MEILNKDLTNKQLKSELEQVMMIIDDVEINLKESDYNSNKTSLMLLHDVAMRLNKVHENLHTKEEIHAFTN